MLRRTWRRRRVGIHKLRLLRWGDFQNGLNFRVFACIGVIGNLLNKVIQAHPSLFHKSDENCYHASHSGVSEGVSSSLGFHRHRQRVSTGSRYRRETGSANTALSPRLLLYKRCGAAGAGPTRQRVSSAVRPRPRPRPQMPRGSTGGKAVGCGRFRPRREGQPGAGVGGLGDRPGRARPGTVIRLPRLPGRRLGKPQAEGVGGSSRGNFPPFSFIPPCEEIRVAADQEIRAVSARCAAIGVALCPLWFLRPSVRIHPLPRRRL